MANRAQRKLEAEYAARSAARSAVIGRLWSDDAAYRRLCERKDRLNLAVSHALAYAPATADKARAAFSRACKRCQRAEDAALAAAGFTP